MNQESFEKMDGEFLESLKSIREKKVPEEIRKNFKRSVEARILSGGIRTSFGLSFAAVPLLVLALGVGLCWFYLKPSRPIPEVTVQVSRHFDDRRGRNFVAPARLQELEAPVFTEEKSRFFKPGSLLIPHASGRPGESLSDFSENVVAENATKSEPPRFAERAESNGFRPPRDDVEGADRLQKTEPIQEVLNPVKVEPVRFTAPEQALKVPQLPQVTESNLIAELEVLKELGVWTEQDEEEIGIPSDQIFEELETMAGEMPVGANSINLSQSSTQQT